MNSETYFVTLSDIQEKISPVLNRGSIEVVHMDSKDMKDETDVTVKQENQHESRWGDEVEQDASKKEEKNENAMDTN